MDQSTLRSFETQCTQEEPPACQTTCPLHVEARTFAVLMAQGRLADARKILDRAMPLPGLVGRLCEGDCMRHCRRAEVDAAVNMPMLELACVSLTSPTKSMLMPSTGKRIAVAGAGLSSLAVAWELAKKGHTVTIFYLQCTDVEPGSGLGGRLTKLPEERLPRAALDEAIGQLRAMRVTFEAVAAFAPAWRDAVLSDSLALYIGLDDSLSLANVGIDGITNFLTQETADPRVFAGGLPGGSTEFIPLSRKDALQSFIREAADGKRAAGSIIRLLQGVAPATAREKEGVYPTALFTDVSGVFEQETIKPANPAAPSADEAKAEAERCIQCECLECVKRCPYLAHYKGYPKRYAREIYNNLSVVHGLRRTNGQINSCAECGLCAAVCPNKTDMGEFCSKARREMTLSRRMPPSAHEFALEDMAYSNAPDVAFFRHQPGTTASAWALFPGCQLPASLPEATKSLYEHLCRNLQGGVGLFVQCCGAPAKWSGRDILTATGVAALRAAWTEAGKPTLLLACASCSLFMQEELPDLPVLSLWDALADLPLPDSACAAPTTLALHDPCAARKAHSTRESVRRLASSLRQPIEELPLGRELTRCCGYGGLADAANPAMGAAYAQARADDTDNMLLAYCIMCRDRLSAVGKECLHLLDLLFPQSTPMDAAKRPAPGITDRQQGRLTFRQEILHALWNEQPQGSSAMDAIILNMDDDLLSQLEKRRILHTDIKAVLLHAQKHGPQFVRLETQGANERCLTSYRPKQVTFWVDYTIEGDGSYTIHDAYCHRMVVPGTPGQGLPTAVMLEGHADKGGRM